MSDIDNDLAFDAINRGDYKAALHIFKLLVERNLADSDTYLQLAWLYQTGNGAVRDLDKALESYKIAVAKGSHLGDFYIAKIYRLKNENDKALEYYVKSADSGKVDSSYWAGSMFLIGDGGSVDLKRAKKYLKIAADGGHVFAQRDLALCHIRGTFGKRELLKGYINWGASIIKGLTLSFKDSNNEKLS